MKSFIRIPFWGLLARHRRARVAGKITSRSVGHSRGGNLPVSKLILLKLLFNTFKIVIRIVNIKINVFESVV